MQSCLVALFDGWIVACKGRFVISTIEGRGNVTMSFEDFRAHMALWSAMECPANDSGGIPA